MQVGRKVGQYSMTHDGLLQLQGMIYALAGGGIRGHEAAESPATADLIGLPNYHKVQALVALLHAAADSLGLNPEDLPGVFVCGASWALES